MEERTINDETIQLLKSWLEEDPKDIVHEKQYVSNPNCINEFTEKENEILDRFGNEILKPIGHTDGYIIINISLSQIEDALVKLGILEGEDVVDNHKLISYLEKAMDEDTERLIGIFKELLDETYNYKSLSALAQEDILEFFAIMDK